MKTAIDSKRLLSLDAFRGAVIAGMILVNNPGTFFATYPQLRHAAWHGWTFADWIFPFFLFIVGVAMTFSFVRRREKGDGEPKLLLQVVKRSIILFVLGLLVQGFPYISLSASRVPGTLQKIGVCYFFASLVVLKSGIKAQVYWTVGLLLSYWLIMRFIPVPGVGAGVYEPGRNFATYVDSLVFPRYVPPSQEIVAVISGVPSTLFGVLTGHWLQSTHSQEEKTAWMFVVGNLLILLGVILDMWLPINKNLWTSSYSIFMAGWALVCLAVFYWLIDVKGYKRWAAPLVIFGMNAIAVFVLDGGVVGRLLRIIKWT